MIDWRELASQVDAIADAQFGEPVRIEPASAGDYSPGAPDGRTAVDVTGILQFKEDQAMPLAGDHSGAQFRGRMAVANIALWITTSELAGFVPKAGDVVSLLHPTREGAKFEINRSFQGADGRTMLSLIRGAT